MSRPDGWSRLPDGSWSPPPRQVVDPINYRQEAAPDVPHSVIREGAVFVRDADDDIVVRMGKLSTGEYGLEVFDSDGNTRVIIGKDDGVFDVKVFNDDGEFVKLATLAFGLEFDQVLGEESTQSTTYTDLATVGPSVTVDVGPTGRVIVTAGAFSESTVTNQSVLLGLSIDGGAAQDWAGVENNSGGAIGMDVAHTEEIVNGQSWGGSPLDLSEGEHTFTFKYRQTLAGANNANFAFRYIMVQPF